VVAGVRFAQEVEQSAGIPAGGQSVDNSRENGLPTVRREVGRRAWPPLG